MKSSLRKALEIGRREEISAKTCIFDNCQLKCIYGYDLCYQHIDVAFGKKDLCVWPYDGAKCNQFAIKSSKHSENDLLLCANHYARYRLNKLRKTQNTLKEKKQENSAPNVNESKYDQVDLELLDSSDSLDQNLFDICASREPHSENEQIETELSDPNAVEMETSVVSSYNREELIKIFKCKLSKLQYLYKKQLTQLNDRLIYDRRVYLDMREKECADQSRSTTNSSKMTKIDKKKIQAARRYKSITNKMEDYLIQKYHPKHANLSNSIYNQFDFENNELKPSDTFMYSRCIFKQANISSQTAESTSEQQCEQFALPCSKFCRLHILNDTNQVLFEPCGHSEQTSNETTSSENNSTPLVCKTATIADLPGVQCKFHINKSLLEQIDAESSSKLDKMSFSDCSHVERLLKSSTEKRNLLPEHLIKLARLNREQQTTRQNKEASQSARHFQQQISSNSNSNESIKSYYSEGSTQRNRPDPSKIVRIKDELIESIDPSSSSEHSMQIKQEACDVEDKHQEGNESTLIENETDSESDESINTSLSSSSSCSSSSSTASSSADSSTSSSNESSTSSDSSSTTSTASSSASTSSPSTSDSSSSNSNKQTEAQTQNEQMDLERD